MILSQEVGQRKEQQKQKHHARARLQKTTRERHCGRDRQSPRPTRERGSTEQSIPLLGKGHTEHPQQHGTGITKDQRGKH